MHFQTVKQPQDPFLPFVKDLYLLSFPAHERREWPQLLSILGTGNGMCLQVMLEIQELLGFVITWEIRGWCFIEHFAIAADQRGRNIGSRVIELLGTNHKILLEVEPPESEDAKRRISFYERAGFQLLPVSYQQPSYLHSHISYPMMLMSNKMMADAEEGQELQMVITELKSKVYDLPGKL